jgi:hypothetical protein
MTTFDSILSHLGPSARPLMVFLHNKEATALLTTNRYIAGFVVAHAARWGFVNPPYSQHANGGFTLRTGTQTLRFPPLRHWENLVFARSHFARPADGTYHYYVGKPDAQTTLPLIFGSKAEIMAIRDAARPYLMERQRRLPIEAAARAAAKAKAEAEAAAAKAAADHIATYTIRAGPPPPVNPWGPNKG